MTRETSEVEIDVVGLVGKTTRWTSRLRLRPVANPRDEDKTSTCSHVGRGYSEGRRRGSWRSSLSPTTERKEELFAVVSVRDERDDFLLPCAAQRCVCLPDVPVPTWLLPLRNVS
jgi:hypothetical protein